MLSAPYRYKVFKIPKRTPGQFRTIAQPAKEIKRIQYWILDRALSLREPHPCATAYRRLRNIANNAEPHTTGRYLLKMDFTDFFPSIKFSDVQRCFSELPMSIGDLELHLLSRAVCWRPKEASSPLCLSIGAPTSPMLSNLIMIPFDERIGHKAADLGCSYTRYADDITFSAHDSEALAKIESAVFELCNSMESPRLTVNPRKTVRCSRADSRRVTGLILTNDSKVSLGRAKKRTIRAQVHSFLVNKLPKEEVEKLKGMLAYANAVEPSFVARLASRYPSALDVLWPSYRARS